MRDASVPEAKAPRRDAYDVNGRLFSNPNGTVDGIMNSILRGTAHDSTLPRLNGSSYSKPAIRGSFFGHHGPGFPPPEPCNFSGCVARAWMSTPFCFQHLAGIRSNRQKGTTTAPTPPGTGTGASTAPSTGPPVTDSIRNPPLQASQSPITGSPAAAAAAAAMAISPFPMSSAPHTARNTLPTTYMGRKTTLGGGPRPAPLTTSSHGPRAGASSYINGAPVTPSSRAGGESPGSSYFGHSHTLSQQNIASSHNHNNGEQGKQTIDKDMTAAAGAILTPSESPPDMWERQNSRKRSRSDFQDPRHVSQQTNGANGASANNDKETESSTSKLSSQGNDGSILPTTNSRLSNGYDTRAGPPTYNRLGNPQTHQQTATPAAQNQNKTPTLSPDQHHGTDVTATAGPSTSSTSSTSPTPTRLGLREALKRRIEEREKQKQQAQANGTLDTASTTSTPIVPMTFSLDTYIYSQGPDVAPLSPPPEVLIPSRRRLEEESAEVASTLPTAYSYSLSRKEAKGKGKETDDPEFVHAHIDPRVHWTRARSQDWHDAKQKEIAARGGRKANFGKAAQRAATARRLVEKEAAEEAAKAAATAAAASQPDETTGSAGGENTVEESPNGRRSLRNHKASATPASQPAPATPAPVVPQIPSTWSGELPIEVVSNRSWVSMLRSFAQDEHEWRTQQTPANEANQKAHKSNGRSKGRH